MLLLLFAFRSNSNGDALPSIMDDLDYFTYECEWWFTDNDCSVRDALLRYEGLGVEGNTRKGLSKGK